MSGWLKEHRRLAAAGLCTECAKEKANGVFGLCLACSIKVARNNVRNAAEDLDTAQQHLARLLKKKVKATK